MVAQILAVVIFVAMFLLIVMDKIERHIVTLACGLATLVLVFGVAMQSMEAIMETLSFREIFTVGFWYAGARAEESSSGINWATIIFIFGMMVMVEGMAKAGFFRWLCMRLAKLVNYKPIPLFIAFMIMSAFLAMFIDSITVILFLAAVTVELAKLLKFNPVPMILSEIFCANLGGSATMCGDPPNIIIGTSLSYSFSDFLLNTGLMAAVSLVLVVILSAQKKVSVTVVPYSAVVSRSNEIRAHLSREVCKRTEFNLAVAQHVGVGSTPLFILIQKQPEHIVHILL